MIGSTTENERAPPMTLMIIFSFMFLQYIIFLSSSALSLKSFAKF